MKAAFFVMLALSLILGAIAYHKSPQLPIQAIRSGGELLLKLLPLLILAFFVAGLVLAAETSLSPQHAYGIWSLHGKRPGGGYRSVRDRYTPESKSYLVIAEQVRFLRQGYANVFNHTLARILAGILK
jgi:hypothetical protein